MENEIGTTISWRADNGKMSGVVTEKNGSDYLVRLDNGKYINVNKKSICR